MLKTPEVITHGYLGERGYIVTKYDDGQRLSQLGLLLETLVINLIDRRLWECM